MSSSRYTFAVCTKCGVQGQPIIMTPLVDVEKEIRAMGWRVDAAKFKLLAVCPVCSEKD